MNILDVIMNAQGGNAVRQAGAQVGLGEAETATALSALVPVLAAGFQRNLESPDGLTGLLGALTGGGHQRYIDDPTALAGATADGNGILGHVLGGKDVSRALADRASTQTGISPEVLKQLLPIAASLMMGAFSRQQAQGGALDGRRGQPRHRFGRPDGSADAARRQESRRLDRRRRRRDDRPDVRRALSRLLPATRLAPGSPATG